MTPMITTHILDTSRGRPAAGVIVKLYKDTGVEPVAAGVTNADGRVAQWDQVIEPGLGNFRLEFEVEKYFSASGVKSFYSDIQIAFKVENVTEHYHVPLLLNPFGYSTYRGS